ncbi:hypothetical protein [Ulvibacter litoralis]|uniref:Uncharacterized protein n=1 Tax=Ulvibacter litoralis TaxID=227084 RepID=A0A1G7DFP7_9FLAO|nr:hypothetical protein [Ulvibacter litoralis]GHC43875.1 hypothetical protein GCM10008083_02940 [Ulvibacter litoralis]SDE49635.1 hypothetical protein SAMN05421855_101915 [Ulvibacter litoralis]
MKFFNTLIIILLISLTSCEKDSLVVTANETNLTTHTAVTQSRGDFTGKIKRVKIRRRRIGGYNITSKADGTGGINHYEVTINEREGITPIPSKFDLNLNGELDEDGFASFNFKALRFEGDNPEGKPFLIAMTPMDKNNNPLGDTEKVWATVQDDDGVDINNVLIKQTNVYGIYKYKVNLGGENVEDIANVSLSVEGLDNEIKFPVDGGALALEADPDGTNVWATIAVTYESASEQTALLVTPGNTVGVSIFLTNTMGELIDEEVHHIVVTEKPQEEGIVSQPVTIKLKNNGNGFKIRTKVKGTDKDKVKEVRIIFEEPFEGPAPLETEYTLEFTNENVTTRTFVSETMNFEHLEEAIGSEYLVLIDYIDENGNPVSFQTEQLVIIEGNQNEEFTITDVKVEQQEGDILYKAKAFIDGPEIGTLENATITLEPLGDGSPIDTDFLELQLQEQADEILYFGSHDFKFENYDVVDGQEYLATFKADNNGTETIELTATITVTYENASEQ